MVVVFNYCDGNIKKIDPFAVIKYCLVIVSALLIISVTCSINIQHILTSNCEHFGTNGTSMSIYSHTWLITAAGVASVPATTLSRQIRIKRSICLICLLLVINTEMNPRPTRLATRSSNAAGGRNNDICSLNERSAVNKATEIHLTVEDERLDVEISKNIDNIFVKLTG